MRKKIFCGPADTAGNASLIALALRSVGIHADAILETKYPIDYKNHKIEFYFKKYPLNKLNKILKIIYFIKYLIKYDIFIFNSVRSLLNDNKDLPILKLLKRKIAIIYGGCEAQNPEDISRFHYIFCNYCNETMKKHFGCTTDRIGRKYAKVKYFEKYADVIFTFDDVAGYLEKNFFYKYHVAPYPPQKDYLKKYDSGKLTIIHCPTKVSPKRTDIVMKVIEKLKDENCDLFDFFLLSNVSNDEVLKRLESTHILIDQFLGRYGLLAAEAMARGVIVIEKLDDWFLKRRPDCPAISTDADHLYGTLVKLLKNRNILKRIGQRSINYYQKYHSPKSAGNYYAKCLELL